MAAIEARSLRKTYGDTVALDGIDLRVEEGRILGIVGPNGAAKSTRAPRDARPPPLRGRAPGARP